MLRDYHIFPETGHNAGLCMRGASDLTPMSLLGIYSADKWNQGTEIVYFSFRPRLPNVLDSGQPTG